MDVWYGPREMKGQVTEIEDDVPPDLLRENTRGFSDLLATGNCLQLQSLMAVGRDTDEL